MKILYADSAVDGHHSKYIKSLCDNSTIESIVVLPQDIQSLGCKQYVFNINETIGRSIKSCFEYIKEIRKVADIEKPDLIHILTGDIFREYLAFGLCKLNGYKVVITMHQLPERFLSKIGALLIAKKADEVVVHSDYLKEFYKKIGAKNVHSIMYPSFDIVKMNNDYSKEYFGLKKNIPVLLALGETRYDKGVDILLKALKNVNKDFQILIAGGERFFKKEYIEQISESYKEKLFLVLRYLTDEEMKLALNASDIVVVPYRKRFNATSGPMNDGVWLEKCIIGPNHGNLGKTISENKLGYTFESENEESLANTINDALGSSFDIDVVYQSYRNMLSVDKFKEAYYSIYKEI